MSKFQKSSWFFFCIGVLFFVVVLTELMTPWLIICSGILPITLPMIEVWLTVQVMFTTLAAERAARVIVYSIQHGRECCKQFVK